jgi:hypothetical protein
VSDYAQTPAVLDHWRTLPQGDGRAGPAFTRRVVGSEYDLIPLDAGDVLGIRSWKCWITAASDRGIEIASTAPAAVLNSTTQVPSVFGP